MSAAFRLKFQREISSEEKTDLPGGCRWANEIWAGEIYASVSEAILVFTYVMCWGRRREISFTVSLNNFKWSCSAIWELGDEKGSDPWMRSQNRASNHVIKHASAYIFWIADVSIDLSQGFEIYTPVNHETCLIFFIIFITIIIVNISFLVWL